MKANEYIKYYGWAHARYISNKWDQHKSLKVGEYSTTYYRDDEGETNLEEMRRLVESHDLVEVEGGIDEVKHTFSFASKHGVDELTEYGKRLKEAIADVESCVGVG